jgi:GrpB-like predicted nucleotidyltransferase (UPF0157 family)
VPHDVKPVLYCLLTPGSADALEAVRAHYAVADPRVWAIVDRRMAQRRRGPLSEAPRGPERRGAADRRRFVVPRRMAPLPAELAASAGEVRWIQRLMPVTPATEAMTNEQVVEAVRTGSTEAPTELYWRYYERVRSRLVVLLGSGPDTDPAVVVAFGTVLDALDGSGRMQEPFDQLLYDLVDAAAEDVLAGREVLRDPSADGIAVRDPALDEPVRVVEPDGNWAKRARDERERLLDALGDHVVTIEHVGGTAVPSVAGRDVIDLMLGVRDLPVSADLVTLLAGLGYVDCGDAGAEDRRYLRMRGGREAIDLHVVEHDGPLWLDTFLWREFLRRNPVEAQRWSAIKRDAARMTPESAARYFDLRRLTLEELLEKARRNKLPHAA